MTVAGPARRYAGDPTGKRIWFAHFLRGPACLLVIFAHFTVNFLTAPEEVAAGARFEPVDGLPAIPWAAVVGGWRSGGIELGSLGVLLFFLVSGFVIPFSLANRDLKGFGIRRFFRLYPTLWLCTLLTLGALALQSRLGGGSLQVDAATLAAYGTLLAPYLGVQWIEPVLWTLAVEEMFYVLAALLAWRGRLGSAGAIALVAGGLAALAAGFNLLAPAATNFWLWFWMGQNATCVLFILIGLVFHLVYQRQWSPGKGLAGVAGLAVLYAGSILVGPMRGVAAVYLVSGALALGLFALLYLLRDRIPYSRTADRLSGISYPLYLIHGVNGFIVMRAVFMGTGSYALALAAALTVSFLLAIAVHRWVELPTNRVGHLVARRRRERVVQGAVAPAASGID